MIQITRKQVLIESINWLNVPWEHQGRSRIGCDCAGYVQGVATSLGCNTAGLPKVPTYSRDPDTIMEKYLDVYLKRKNNLQRLPASILFFAFGRHAQHLGILSAKGDTFYHGYETEGKSVETRLDKRWVNRLRGVYDFFEVID